ncbi:Uncharacterised protein [Yersinia enterocolitica subsp. enterocolitica]|nr:Uncharacterised protein [Yersinia enterocolitica subsp. enterocolitica]
MPNSAKNGPHTISTSSAFADKDVSLGMQHQNSLLLCRFNLKQNAY